MKVPIICETCCKTLYRYPSEIRAHTFCSRDCAKRFTSARMTDYNRHQNPMNTPDGWSAAQKEAARERQKSAKGECAPNTYPKAHGRHEHRAVAERILGRSLRPGEVVHHINGDKHDNRPENLMIFASQKAHVEYHAAHPEESGVRLGKRVI